MNPKIHSEPVECVNRAVTEVQHEQSRMEREGIKFTFPVILLSPVIIVMMTSGDNKKGGVIRLLLFIFPPRVCR
jgi:hypothetical protein